MKNRDGLENSNHWATPKYLYDELNNEFNFDFDPCPLHADFDGLSSTTEWGKSNFINPPYDRINKPKFIERSYKEWQKGKVCVLLIPSATGTYDFHNMLLHGAYITSYDYWLTQKNKDIEIINSKKIILFLRGRIAFEGYNTKGEWTNKNKGKHDSMIVILKQ